MFVAVWYAVVCEHIGMIGSEQQVGHRFGISVAPLQVDVEPGTLFLQCLCKPVLTKQPFRFGDVGSDAIEPVERIVKQAWFQMECKARACFDNGVVDDDGIADIVQQEVDDAIQHLHVLYQPYLDVPDVEAAQQHCYLLFDVGYVYPFSAVELDIVLESQCRHYAKTINAVGFKGLYISKHTGSARRVEAGNA